MHAARAGLAVAAIFLSACGGGAGSPSAPRSTLSVTATPFTFTATAQ